MITTSAPQPVEDGEILELDVDASDGEVIEISSDTHSPPPPPPYSHLPHYHPPASGSFASSANPHGTSSIPLLLNPQPSYTYDDGVFVETARGFYYQPPAYIPPVAEHHLPSDPYPPPYPEPDISAPTNRSHPYSGPSSAPLHPPDPLHPQQHPNSWAAPRLEPLTSSLAPPPSLQPQPNPPPPPRGLRPPHGLEAILIQPVGQGPGVDHPAAHDSFLKRDEKGVLRDPARLVASSSSLPQPTAALLHQPHDDPPPTDHLQHPNSIPWPSPEPHSSLSNAPVHNRIDIDAYSVDSREWSDVGASPKPDYPAQHCDLPPRAPPSSSSSPSRQHTVSASHASSRSASPPCEASPQPAPQKKPSLAELRRKVLMSIKNPTNLPPRPAPPEELPLRTSSSVSPVATKAPKAPTLPPPAPPPASLPLPGSRQPAPHTGVMGATSPSPFGPERTFATRASQQALMTSAELPVWQGWPFQCQVIVYFDSDDDDDDDDDEDGELASYRTNTLAAPTKKLTREEEIESMKMRIVRLGKCPSILLGDFSGMSPRAEASSCARSPSVSMKSKENTPSLKRRSPAPTPISVAHQAAVDTEKSHTMETERSKADQPLNPNGGVQKTMFISATQPLPSRSMSPVSHHPVRKKPRTPLRESKMEELTLMPQKSPALHMVNTPVNSRKPAKDSSLAIADLKRKIAELEHQKEERELKKLRLSDQTNVSCAAKGAMKPQHLSTPQGAPRADSIAQKSRNGKFAHKAKARDDNSSPQMPLSKTAEGKGRYYAGAAAKVQRKSSVSLTIIAEDDDDSSDSSCHTEDAQGAWNRKESVSNPAQSIADRTQDGLIDDLRSELEKSKRELTNVRDTTRLVQAADVSVAEAFAKYSFKRSRLQNLTEELEKARLEVLKGEEDYRSTVTAAKSVRTSLGEDAENVYADLEKREGIEIPGVGRELSDITGSSATINDVAAEVEERRSRADEVEDMNEDLVLRPSPYSASGSDEYSSCLSGLRAYILRVPRDSKAADRRSISPMSLTWTSKIDPMKTVCPQELRGQCSKVACEYQHLRRFESPKSRALRIVDSLEVFFSKAKWQEAEKAIVRTKLAIYGGKNVEESVSNLIASLCPKPGSIPLSTVAN